MPLDDIGHFLENGLEAVAGVRQPLVAFATRAAAHSSASAGAAAAVRVLPGAFMAINQAMGMVQGRAEGAAYLRHFVEEMKASGFVDRQLACSGQEGVAVAPPADPGVSPT